MTPEHLNYAQEALHAFIDSAIQRVAHSGDMVFRFSIAESEIRGALGLSRAVKSTVLADYVEYFTQKGFQATEYMGSIELTLNLGTVSLNPAQARALSAAMSLYRAENT